MLRIGISFVVFYLLDVAQVAVGWFPRSDRNGRYFTLHVLCNAFVTVAHFDEVIFTLKNPWQSSEGESDVSGTCVMMALHLYHIAFYRPLDAIDWIHHIVMILVTTPLAYLFQPGHLMGNGTFFASGM